MSLLRDLEQLATWNATNASTSTRHYIQLGYRDQSTLGLNGEYAPAIGKTLGKIYGDQNQRILSTIQDGYMRERRTLADDLSDLRLAGKIISGTITVGSSITGNPLTSAVGNAMGIGLDYLWGEALGNLEKSAIAAGKGFVGKELLSMKESNSALFEQILELPKDEARDALNDFSKTFYKSDDFSDLDQESRTLIDSFRIVTVEQILNKEIEISKLVDSAQNDKIDNLLEEARRLNSVDKQLSSTLKVHSNALIEVKSAVNDIKDGMASMATDIKNVQGGVIENGRRLDFLSKFVYSNLSPDEQLNALESGALGDIPPSELVERKRQIALLKRKQAIISAAQGTFKALSALPAINEKLGLGLSEDTLKVASAVATYGQGAMNAAMAFASGNYIGAITSVIGLFGGAGDPAAERHSQIMGALNQVLKGQREILENLFELRKEIQHLTKAIIEMHRESMRKLDGIEIEILINRKILKDIVEDPLIEAQQFLESRNQYRFSNGAFSSYEMMALHFSDHADEFRSGILELESYFKEGEVHSIFLSDTYKNKKPNSEQFRQLHTIDRIADLSHSILTETSEQLGGTPDQLIGSLLIPVTTTRSLENKLKSRVQSTPSINRQHEYKFIAENLRNALFVPHILEITRLLTESHFYLQLVSSPLDTKLQNADQIAKKTSLSPRSITHLKRMLRIVRAGIAQQVLFSGDVTAPYLYERLVGLMNIKQIDYIELDWELLELIASNSVLQKNLVVYLSRRELEKSGHNYWSFEVFKAMAANEAIDSEEGIGDGGSLREILPSGWKFHLLEKEVNDETSDIDNKKKTWALVFPLKGDGSFSIPLPNGSELADDVYRYSPELVELLNAQDLLISVISQYTIYEQLEGSDDALNYARRISLVAA